MPQIFDVNYVRIPLSFFIQGFLRQETAALARAYLGIGAGTGDVTHTGNLTLGQIVVGNGAADLKVLLSPNDATKFLNGAAIPAFAQVKDSDLSTSDITTNNVSIAKHGFAPKAPNDATKFLDGTGNYSVPAGGAGTVTNTGALTDHAVIVGNGGTDVSAIAVGTNNTVLHGNTGADPSYSAVVEADITLADNTTNNVSIARHGFAPKAPNDATKFLDGTGAYSVPTAAGINQLTGDVTAGPGTGSQAATIANDAVTYAKMQNVSAADRLLGRGAGGGSGDVQEITLGTNLSLSGTTLNAAGGGGGGTVTNTGTLTDHGVIVGNGGVDVSALAVGATNTVLHGNTGADPSFSAVVEADITLSDNTTNNASASAHGFLKKLNNDASTFLDGTGNYSTPDSSPTYLEASLLAAGATTSTPVGCTRIEVGTLSQQDVDANQLQSIGYTTTTIVNNDAYQTTSSGASGNWLYGRRGIWFGYVVPITNTDARYWCGISALSPANQAASDAPTGNYAMFRYSSSAGDTKWQCVVGDGSSTEVMDSGVTVSNTVMVKLEIRWDGTATNSFDFFINNTLVATGTLDPASTTAFRMGCQVRNLLGGATRRINVAGERIRAFFP